MEETMKFPALYPVTRQFGFTEIKDIPGAVQRAFSQSNLAARVRPGQRIAVGVGSRGIHHLREIVASAIGCLKEMGLVPYITPAMGSHGGATAPGQIEVLSHLGITQSGMGVPIRAGMEVASLGKIECGAEVYAARDVMDAHHIMVINRVKPHTMFRGRVESGLCKMLCIGLGRQAGASSLHKYNLAEVILPAAGRIMERLPVLAGLAVTETAAGGTHSLDLAMAESIMDLDIRLQAKAKELLPRLPMEHLDILIVERMGKEISGAGMDPNVIGFWRREGGEKTPDFRVVVVLDLTDASGGNAVGIGLADLTTKRVLEKVDIEVTATNSLTSGRPQTARLPIGLAHDKAAIRAAMELFPDPDRVRMARIKDTGHLTRFWVSRPVLDDLEGRDNVRADTRPMEMVFDPNGRLMPFEKK